MRTKILHHPGDTIRHLYFPLNCLVSITVTMREGKTAEAGAVGNREVVGVNAFMGGSETNQTEYVVHGRRTVPLPHLRRVVGCPEARLGSAELPRRVSA